MSKQDRIYPRTPAQLEQQYNFGKTFAEILGVASDAQTHAQQAAEEVGDKIDNDDYNQVVKMKNAADDVIEINSNRLIINSDYFKLAEDGTIEATAGKIGDCDLNDGKLVVKKLETKSDSIDTFDVGVDNYGVIVEDTYYATAITSGVVSILDKATGASLSLSPTGLALGTTVLTETQLEKLLALIE